MRVFYIDPQSYNNLSLYDFSLLSPMKDDGEVSIAYYHSDQYQLPEKPVPDSYALFCYNNKPNVVAKSLSYIGSMMRIAKDIWRQRPDVVHVQWTRLWIIDYLFALYAIVCGCRMVHTVHNLLPHSPKRFDKPKCRAYYRLMSAIIVHVQRTANELSAQFGIAQERVHVIHHGVIQPPLIENDAVSEQMKKICQNLGINSGDFVFSCPGYQYKYKGVEMLADVWLNNACFRENPNLHLLLVGKNRDVPAEVFEKLNEVKNVFILDQQIDDVDFEAFLRLSSVILLPYKTISQSGLLFTALCSRIPVAVTDVGGLTEPLQIAKVGWNMGEPTENNLVSMMHYLLDHKEEVAEVRNDRVAFEKIINAYSWEKISADTRMLYLNKKIK